MPLSEILARKPGPDAGLRAERRCQRKNHRRAGGWFGKQGASPDQAGVSVGAVFGALAVLAALAAADLRLIQLSRRLRFATLFVCEPIVVFTFRQ